MSRSRREKEPDAECGHEWGSSDPQCPHVCRLPRDHRSDHVCCRGPEGRVEWEKHV